MKLLQIVTLLVLSTALGLSVFFTADVRGQNVSATEAPTGFDNQTIDASFVDQPTHDADKGDFDQVEQIADGLGPVYNAQSCRECHQNPVSGAISQIKELRAGHRDHGIFVGATVSINDGSATIGPRSLINQRAICPGVDATQSGVVNGLPTTFNFPDTSVVELVPDSENIRTLRTSLNVLGDGFVEAIADKTLTDIAKDQCLKTHGAICGQAISVPVLEGPPGATAIGRFGWKDQHASLLSFSSDAYLNEMGITNRLAPNNVDFTTLCDIVPDPEDKTGTDNLNDIDHFARFMRASKAPPRDEKLRNTTDALVGEHLFQQIGCAKCHVAAITTAPANSPTPVFPKGVPVALGDKIIHPFSDFLLHDVGTGDGIVQNGPQNTANKLRTAPLWGVRLRNELMHDGRSLTFTETILRHGGEATEVIEEFRELSLAEKKQLITFLKSL